MLAKRVRLPAIHSDNPPTLVLLHGLGADEDDLMGLAPSLDPRLMVVCFRAPLKCDFGGYAWFEIEWDAIGPHADEGQALESREILLEELKELPGELGVQPSKLFLGGFSQGAMMSLGASLVIPEMLCGVLLMSGRMLPGFVAEPPAPGFEELPFLVQHGTADQVLPVTGAREIGKFLHEKGCPLTYKEYPMAHEISLMSLEDIRKWMELTLN